MDLSYFGGSPNPKTRDIVGKTVAKVDQSFCSLILTFEDGSTLEATGSYYDCGLDVQWKDENVAS